MPHSGAAITAVQMTALPAPCAQLSIPVSESYLWYRAAPFPRSFAPSASPVQCLTGHRFGSLFLRCEGPPVVPVTPSLPPVSATPEAWAALRWALTWGPPHTPVSVKPPPSSIVNSAATTTAHIARSLPPPLLPVPSPHLQLPLPQLSAPALPPAALAHELAFRLAAGWGEGWI